MSVSATDTGLPFDGARRSAVEQLPWVFGKRADEEAPPLTMVLENLALLDASMRASDCRGVRCTVRCGGLVVSVVYLNDACPQELLMFRHEPRRWLRVPVQAGHNVEPQALRPLVEPDAPPESIASPAVRRFLEDFAIALPRAVGNGVERATSEVILQHSLDVEEPTRIYFAGWLPLVGEAVRPQHPNLQKTRRAFGQDAYELCLHLQMGSRWSDQVSDRQPFKLPE